MTRSELKKVVVVEKIISGHMTNEEGAAALGLTSRQVIRLKKKYAWLEDRAPALALHAAIDDATGIVVGGIFRPTECHEGYSLVMQQGIKQYGIPLGL